MFWGGKKKEDDKEKQLKHLKAAFPSMRRPNNDDRLFELRFTVDNQYNTLRITVHDDFPQSRPVYQVLGPVVHQWLDGSKMVSGCRKLNDWNPKSSSLLEITEDILAALLNSRGIPSSTASTASTSSAQPPSQPSQPSYPLNNYPGHGVGAQKPPSNPSLQSYNQLPPSSSAAQPSVSYPNLNTNQYQAAAAATTTTTVAPSSSVTTGGPSSGLTVSPPAPSSLQREDSLNSPMQMALPDIPTQFPELEQLTDVQLERLLRDTVALDAHIAAMDSVQAMESLRDMQRETNAHAAARNIQTGEEVKKLQVQAQMLQAEIKALYGELSQTSTDIQREDQAARDKLLSELKKIITALDEESEAIGEGLIRGTVDLATFKRDYHDRRSRFYTLTCRMELATAAAASSSHSNA